jgi:hypothetical protein
MSSCPYSNSTRRITFLEKNMMYAMQRGHSGKMTGK